MVLPSAVTDSARTSRMRTPPSTTTLFRVKAGSVGSWKRCTFRVLRLADTSRKSIPFIVSDSLTRLRRRSFPQMYWVAISGLPRELRHLALLVAAYHVLDRYSQGGLLAFDLNGLDLDQVSQPLLQGALHQELGGGGQLVAVGSKDELRQPAAEVRPVDTLAGRGEQQLLYEISNVRLGVRGRRPPSDVQVERVVDLHQAPLTRIWVATTFRPVPVGAHIAWLSCSNKGSPFERTRTEPVTHWAVTHGPFAAGGGGNVQPAITYGPVWLTVGWPPTMTRGFGTVACAWPACMHRTVAPTCRRKPGIRSPPARRC